METNKVFINSSPVTFGGQGSIDSQALLVMVNDTRKEYGEPPIRNNVFVERIKDELEGETYKIFVGQKNGAEIEIIEMVIKQALRVAARESKAVRRSLVDKLEAMHNAKPQTQNEIIAAMALANVEQDRRLSHVEDQVEAVTETIEQIKRGSVPAGWLGYSVLKIKSGMTPSKCKTLVKAYSVPTDTITIMTPEGQPRPMAIVQEAPFMSAFRRMMAEAEQRGTRWYHPLMGLFQVIGWEAKQ